MLVLMNVVGIDKVSLIPRYRIDEKKVNKWCPKCLVREDPISHCS